MLGPLGERPDTYWTLGIAHHFHLKKADMGDLTYSEIYAALDAINDVSKA